MTRGFLLWIFIAVLLALGLRSIHLERRPLHSDEAVNAAKFKQLWEGGGYAYDPNENHGPTLEYSTLVWNKLTQLPDFARMGETRLRSLPVLFGLGLILLLPLVSDGLGRNAVLAAAFLTAVSPVMVYYSRDYIHETLFVFFTFLALAAGWRHSQTGKWGWILLAGAAIGLMQATKETFVFNIAAIGGALLLNECFPAQGRTKRPSSRGMVVFRPAHLIAAGVAWLIVAFVLFTSFFSHPSGLLDAARTYLFWTKRAAGDSPHIHGWGFYWERLLFFHIKDGPVWSEALIFALAVGGGISAFSRRRLSGANIVFVRFLLFYTLILALIYTALPYKTPWCALDFWHGAILLAGVGAAALLDWLPNQRLKIAAGVALLAGTAQLAFQSWQSSINLKYVADPSNPWVYAQTSPDIFNLVDMVDAVAQVSPEGRGTDIDLIAPGADYYPLPWYLRRYGHLGFETETPGYSKFTVGTMQNVRAFVLRLLASPTFSVDEIKDLSKFIYRLRKQSDPVSAFLWQKLSSPDQKTLTDFEPPATNSSQLQKIIVQTLNKTVGGPSLYEQKRFQGIGLRPETTRLMAQSPPSTNLARLNRLLLEDAYPLELSRNLLSDPVSQFLTRSGITNNLDAAHPANGDPDHLESLLVTNLNNILIGASIYDSNRFQGIRLRPETDELRRQNPHGQDLIRLNRRLLEDACTNELGVNNLPAEPYAPITIVSTKLEPDVDQEKAGIPMTYELRPNVFLELYVQSNLWNAYLKQAAK